MRFQQIQSLEAAAVEAVAYEVAENSMFVKAVKVAYQDFRSNCVFITLFEKYFLTKKYYFHERGHSIFT